MSEERLDCSIERQRHEGFVGRTSLLARLDRLLIADNTDRWVVVTGGPGMGKSALLAAWLARREAMGAKVPHHFIRRGEYDWDDPAKLVGSLVWQIRDRFPDVDEPSTDARRHPAARLASMLARVSANKLAPRGERLVVMIDGLDEYDRPPGTPAGDPLAAFLPHALPRGVSFLGASRPKHPYVELLEARDGELVQIDLDDPRLAKDNEATVRAFWECAAPPLDLDARFIDQAVARAGGNLQHAAALRNRLIGLPVALRRVEDIPSGLKALLSRSWQRIAIDPVAVHGLGILCTAREALTVDEIATVAGWTSETQRQAFMGGARELLVETRRTDTVLEYRLHHDTIRTHVARAIGGAALQQHHAELARRFATWPPLPDATARRYVLRHALIHRAEAGDWADAWRLAADVGFLKAKCRELGVHDLEADVARVAERCRVSLDEGLRRRFADLARALVYESHWLRSAPDAIAALVWNRLRRSAWSADDIDDQLRVSPEDQFLRVRRVVERASPAHVRDLAGHTKEVIACAVMSDRQRVASTSFMACAVLPDDQRAISASFDKTLKVWNLHSGRVLATLEGHTSWVTACAVMADGRRVVSGADDGTLKIWDLESGRALVTLEGHRSQVNACATTGDGRYVVSGSNDGTLKIWDSTSGKEISTLEGHADWVRTCAVTPDGQRVVSGSYDGTLKVWDLQSGSVLATLEGHTDWIRACAVTMDGRRVVSGSRDGTLKVWDLQSGSVLATLTGHTGWVLACAVTADGRHVISGAADGTVRVWDLQNGRALAILKGHVDWVRTCGVTADGRYAVSGSADGTLKIWDLECAVATPVSEADRVRACVIMADGRRVVAGSDDGTLLICDLEDGHVLATLKGQGGAVRTCAVTPNDRYLVSGTDDGTLRLWDLDQRCVLATLKGHTERVNACAVTADGRWMVFASADGTLRTWDLQSQQVLATLRGHHGGVTACAVTPDSRRVVSGSSDGTLKLWEFETGYELATMKGHTDWVNACAVTADGRRMISASKDQTLKVWELETGCMLATLREHTDGVYACAVTADGRCVVSASSDRTLKVWDLETHDCLFTHRGVAAFTAVAVTESAIGAGDAAGAIWILDWPPSSYRAHPRRRNRSQLWDGTAARSKVKQHTILFLAANPSGIEPRAIKREAREIQVALERSRHRDRFDLVTRWAVQPLDLLDELRKLKPTVVHFSGHGSSNFAGEHHPARTPRCDLVGGSAPSGVQRHGLFFQDAAGQARFVSTEALEKTFGAAGASVGLVVLNACHSELQAEALLAHVDCVVGMSGAIDSDAARSFAIGFYGGLGECESVAAAYKQGRAAINLEGLPDHDRPRLKVRVGIDPSQFVLAADPR